MTLRSTAPFCATLALFLSAAHAQTTLPSMDAPASADTLNLRFADGIAAIAEGEIITVDDVRHQIAPLLPEIQREAHNEKELNDKLEALQDDIIQNMIDRVLIVKDFRKDEKKKIPASYVDNQISETLISDFDGDRSKFLAYLRARGKTNRDYRKEVEENIIYDYMRQQQRKSQSTVSPAKIQNYYNENKDQFFQDDSVKLRLIQFNRTPGETDEALKARADAVVAELKNGGDFAEIARQYSQGSTRTKGGDMGWMKRSDLKKEFSDVIFGLEKGQFSSPLVMPEGAYVMFNEDRKVAGIQPLDEVRDQVERILVTQAARAAQERWLERLRRNGYVKHF